MILVAEVARDFQNLMLTKYELKVLPVIHTMGYRHLIYLDTNNEFGCGPNAMVSMSGRDKSICHVVNMDFKDFLVNLAHKLD
jgi:hypothetical protein